MTRNHAATASTFQITWILKIVSEKGYICKTIQDIMFFILNFCFLNT